MERRVHDVEEHFRRSLESIHSNKNQDGGSNKFETEPVQIVVSENSPHINRVTPSPSQTTPISSPTRTTPKQKNFDSQDGVIRMVSPSSSHITSSHQNSIVPPLLLNMPGASSNSPKPESLKTYNEGRSFC